MVIRKNENPSKEEQAKVTGYTKAIVESLSELSTSEVLSILFSCIGTTLKNAAKIKDTSMVTPIFDLPRDDLIKGLKAEGWK